MGLTHLSLSCVGVILRDTNPQLGALASLHLLSNQYLQCPEYLLIVQLNPATFCAVAVHRLIFLIFSHLKKQKYARDVSLHQMKEDVLQIKRHSHREKFLWAYIRNNENCIYPKKKFANHEADCQIYIV